MQIIFWPRLGNVFFEEASSSTLITAIYDCFSGDQNIGDVQ